MRASRRVVQRFRAPGVRLILDRSARAWSERPTAGDGRCADRASARPPLQADAILPDRLFSLPGAALRFALAIAAAAVFGAPALAQGQLRSAHGDWQLRCEQQVAAAPGPAAAPALPREQCALVQSVAAEDKPNVTLVVVALKTADGRSRLLRVVSPLNVLLPAGLGLRIDDADVGNTGFVRCLPTGCVAEVIMDDDLVRQLKGGKIATFIIFEKPEEGIGIPVSLAGFADGFDALP
jgi:invasion protein IalB